MQRILVIEDDPAIRKGLTISLAEEHFDVDTSADGEEGFHKASSGKYDLILLDLMLPGKTGEEICQGLRENKIDTPIIMLTSKREEINKVLGFERGADDYVTKPFSVHELKARIRAILRRSKGRQTSTETFRFGSVDIDFTKQEMTRAGKPVKLSVKEFEILHFFVDHPGEVVTREMLLDEVWGYDVYPTTRTVDTFILNIRKKIEEDPSHPKHLITVHKAGYKFVI